MDAVAASAGLASTAVDDPLNFAGEKGWIEEGPHEGTICVTPAGWEHGKAQDHALTRRAKPGPVSIRSVAYVGDAADRRVVP